MLIKFLLFNEWVYEAPKRKNAIPGLVTIDWQWIGAFGKYIYKLKTEVKTEDNEKMSVFHLSPHPIVPSKDGSQ